MNCPECGREAPTVTYTCTVPGCTAMRFCCTNCILKHMGRHVKERDEELEALKDKVREFISILDITEVSNGREFHPTTINSCRILDLVRIEELLDDMKEIIKGE